MPPPQALAVALACAAAVAGCGGSSARKSATARPGVDSRARAALVRAGRDVLAYGRVHQTFDVGGVAGLHRLDPATRIVDFVDGRQTSFFLAVTPPTTRLIWRWDYDHEQISRASCEPGPGRHCWNMKRW